MQHLDKIDTGGVVGDVASVGGAGDGFGDRHGVDVGDVDFNGHCVGDGRDSGNSIEEKKLGHRRQQGKQTQKGEEFQQQQQKQEQQDEQIFGSPTGDHQHGYHHHVLHPYRPHQHNFHHQQHILKQPDRLVEGGKRGLAATTSPYSCGETLSGASSTKSGITLSPAPRSETGTRSEAATPCGVGISPCGDGLARCWPIDDNMGVVVSVDYDDDGRQDEASDGVDIVGNGGCGRKEEGGEEVGHRVDPDNVSTNKVLWDR